MDYSVNRCTIDHQRLLQRTVLVAHVAILGPTVFSNLLKEPFPDLTNPTKLTALRMEENDATGSMPDIPSHEENVCGSLVR